MMCLDDKCLYALEVNPHMWECKAPIQTYLTCPYYLAMNEYDRCTQHLKGIKNKNKDIASI